MANFSVAHGIDVRLPRIDSNALVHCVRNKNMVRIRSDADYVLLCDDDMAPQKEALLLLLRHQAPIASPLCTTREFPPKLAAHYYDDQKERFVPIPIEEVPPSAVLHGKFGVGAAFLLLQREVLERLLGLHLEAQDWLWEHRQSLDRMHVRAETREREREHISAMRHALYKAEGYHRLFHFSVQDVDQRERGEDMHLTWIAIKAGYRVLIDTGVQVAHIGDFPFGPEFIGYSSYREVRHAHAVSG